uniref:Putative secreted mucin n=1 Tax=Amblyomma cajennense TaxID=34607 RepID=A0A023FE53_AMBCJ
MHVHGILAMKVCTCLLLILCMASAHHGALRGASNRRERKTCQLALREYVAESSVRLPRYFYNNNTKKCERFYWNGIMATGVYNTRFDCASVCNPGETAGYCTKQQPAGCEKGKSTTTKLYPTITTRSPGSASSLNSVDPL